MRRVRLVKDGSIVGHVEVYGLPLTGPGDYLCIPDGLLSDPDLQALAEALDRDAQVIGGAGRQEAAELDVPDDATVLHEPNSAHGSPAWLWAASRRVIRAGERGGG